MSLSSAQTDRAAGALLGAAVGDALGVPYEFGVATLGDSAEMIGGGLGGIAPGQWSDDTEMAVCIARVAATGADLRTPQALDAVAAGFLEWFATGPPDVGNQTRQVLRAPGPDAASMRRASASLHERTGHTAGNGSLMRTSPVPLAHLGDAQAIAEAARLVGQLTHFDPVAADACVLWCLAIDSAIRTGVADVRVGLPHVDAGYWAPLLAEAEAHEPAHFSRTNGWVVSALQAAWSAVSRATSFEDGVQAAVRGGGDTDTVAAIAGGLLGARFGASAIGFSHRRAVHGWPGLRARDLVRLAVSATLGGGAHADGWPSGPRVTSYDGASDVLVAHPDDPGVLLGAVGALRPGVADAVVSLCRLGADEAPVTADPRDHLEVWLVDSETSNADPAGMMRDSARAVRALRAEGKTVLLHCVHAQSRTPTVAAAYGAMITGTSGAAALARVQQVLPSGRRPTGALRKAVENTDWTES